MKSDKIVVFGAGKIGRSFIGQIFNRIGYEVVFVDINEDLIDLINQKREYRVIIKDGDKSETLNIRNVRGVSLKDVKGVVTELLDTRIVSLSVGQHGLKSAVPIIAEALLTRREIRVDTPLDIIIAENMRDADRFLSDQLKTYLPDDYPFDSLVGLVETSIGKMVPIMTQKDIDEDPLQVFAEPFNTLIVAKNGFRNKVPDSPFIAAKENIKAWVDKKLFIHNMGHATVAYLGFKKHPDARYLYEVLNDAQLLDEVKKTMMQSAEILQSLYPNEFTIHQLEEHVDDLIYRFRNISLGDTIFRVGCDLHRKLGPEDRIVAPIRAAIKMGKPFDLILKTLYAGMSFKAKDEKGNHFPDDILFFEEVKKGQTHILSSVCKLPDLNGKDIIVNIFTA